MTLTDHETQALKRILTRELTMIGGEQKAAKKILDKLIESPEIIPTAYEQKVLEKVAEYFRIEPQAIRSQVRKHPIPTARIIVTYHLFKRGKSQRSIGQLLTVDRASVYHYINQFDYPHVKAAIDEIGRIEA